MMTWVDPVDINIQAKKLKKATLKNKDPDFSGIYYQASKTAKL